MLEGFDIEKMIDVYVIPWSINIALAIVVFIVGRLISKGLVKVLEGLLVRAKVDAMLVEFIGSIAGAALFLFVIIASLDMLGVNTTITHRDVRCGGFGGRTGASGFSPEFRFRSSADYFSSLHGRACHRCRRHRRQGGKNHHFQYRYADFPITGKSSFPTARFMAGPSPIFQRGPLDESIWCLASVMATTSKKPGIL